MAVYLIETPSPKNTAVDMSITQDFTAVVRGDEITDYQLIIMLNSTSAILYDTGKVTLGTSIYDGDLLTITVPLGSVSNGQELKWSLQTWENTNTSTPLEEIFFYSYENPSISLTVPPTIAEQSYEFVATWSQTEGLPPKKFQAFLYDVDSNVVDESEITENGNTRHTFSGFIDGVEYGVSFVAYDEFGREAKTTIQTFAVDYSQPNINISPSALSNNDSGAIVVSWGKIVIITANESGVLTYSDDFIFTGDKAVNIPNGGYVEWVLSIPETFTVEGSVEVPTGFTGVLAELGGGTYEFGYDGVKFYVNIGGVLIDVLTTTITNKKWYVGLKPTSIYIKEIV